MKEQMKIRHVIHCKKEKIPTKYGKPIYLTDENKTRKRCLCCGEDFSNIMPTGNIELEISLVIICSIVEYSYFRRHCIAHVLPNPIGRQLFFYKCYVCSGYDFKVPKQMG